MWLEKVAFTMDPVPDIERAKVAQLKANKVVFKLDIFASPVCRMAVILDSEGNAVKLHQKNRKD